MTSPIIGPSLIRCRVVFSPTRPLLEAGMRIEPPPSLAWAIGTIPAATAAPEPPLEPPAERDVSQGLRVAPHAFGSVVATIPSSGVFVLPKVIRPAARKRWARVVSTGEVKLASLSSCMPRLSGSPALAAPRSLSRNGTPLNGPSGTSPAACSRPESERSWMIALISGLTFSARATAASISSAGVASPELTSSACAVASIRARSSLKSSSFLVGAGAA